MPAAAAIQATKTVARTPYANLLSVARWSAVVVGEWTRTERRGAADGTDGQTAAQRPLRNHAVGAVAAAAISNWGSLRMRLPALRISANR